MNNNLTKTKSALMSKTVWIQIASVLSLILPVVGDWLATNPVEFVSALAAINILVRFLTHGKISILTDTGKGVSNLLMMAVALSMALGCGCLVSCSTFSNSASKIDVRTTVDGCLLAGSTTDDGRKIYAGMCADGRYIAKWDQPHPHSQKRGSRHIQRR